jgi:hypothetical protein
MDDKNKVALLIKANANGSEAWIRPKNGKRFMLTELQGLVGGNIEIVHVKMGGKVMIINEEGKLKDLPVNRKATDLYIYGDNDVIVGDVLLMDKNLIR